MSWGVVVLYPVGKDCKHKAGPPRIGAFAGDPITWRIYNYCGRPQTVRITDVRRTDRGLDTPPEEAPYEDVRKPEAARSPLDPGDPFMEDLASRQKTVEAGQRQDLTLTVKREAKPGIYTYLTVLGQTPDNDQEIDIRPPRG